MTDSFSRDRDDHKLRQPESRQEESLALRDGAGVEGSGESANFYSSALLGDRRLGARGNLLVRSSAMQQAQHTHGNRAVQRFLSAQRAAAATAEAEDDEIAKRIEAKAGNGGQLDKTIQAKLESGLGADMSGVRVHTDSEADHMARSVQSVAFTSGQDIFFRSGAFDPNSAEGLKLLAHEATHTVQQSQGPVDGTPSAGGVSISDPSDSFEQAAERAAEAVTSGGQVEVAGEKRLKWLEEGMGAQA